VLDLIPPAAAQRDDQTARVIYLGQVSEDRGALEMIDAMRALADCRTELILMGSTSGSVASLLEGSRPDTAVTVIPWKPPREAYEVLARADIGLVCLHPLPRFQTALPVKLFEYMAAGIPVIASDFPLWREIVDGAACGLLVDPLDASAIAGAIRYLVDHPEERSRMGKNGRAAVEERCNWEHEAAKLLDLYFKIFGEARGRKRA
ncbi:MAG: glycosyltransferase, partial [Candidatus Bipolaricaulia bacterium]